MTNRTPLIVAIVLLLLPVLYVGSYFALVVPGHGAIVNFRFHLVTLSKSELTTDSTGYLESSGP